MRGSRGVTLIEMLVVVALFSVMFAVMVGLIYNSDTYYAKGTEKVDIQFEARRILDTLARELYGAASSWNWNGTHLELTITTVGNDTQLDFYAPKFASNNSLSGSTQMNYRFDASQHRLFMTKGNATETVVSEYVSSMKFTVGCSGCSSYTCTSFANATPDCPVVRMEVGVTKQVAGAAAANFTLSQKVTLHNQNSTIPPDGDNEGPGEGAT